MILITNIIYYFLFFNSQITTDHINPSTNQEELASLPGLSVDMAVYSNIIYIIYRSSFNYFLYAYSDGFLFQVALSNEFSITKPPTIKLATYFGVFVDIGHIILYNNKGRKLEEFQYPSHDAITENYESWIFETTDAIYMVTVMNYRSIQNQVNFENALEIHGWQTKGGTVDFSTGMGTSNLTQTISFTGSNIQQVEDISLEKILLSNRIALLVSNSTSPKFVIYDFVQYRVDITGFSKIKSERLVNVPKYGWHFILSLSDLLAVEMLDSRSISLHFTDLMSAEQLNDPGPFSFSSLINMKTDGTMLVICGGGVVNNGLAPLFKVATSDNGHLRVYDLSSSLQNIALVYSTAQASTTLYLVGGITHSAGIEVKLFRFKDAVVTSLFLDNINPVLQINLLSIPVIVSYMIIIFRRYRTRQCISHEQDLFYPKK